MTIAHDAATESHTGTTGWTTSPNPFTFTHTPVGTPRGVLLFCFVNANQAAFTSATYGGVAMSAVVGGEAADTAGEAGRCKTFFLGSGIPTGARTVSITHNASSAVKYAVVITMTAATDTRQVGTIVLFQNDGQLTEQTVNSGTDVAIRYAGINSGLAAVPAAGPNSTVLHGIDFGSRVNRTARETVVGSGNRLVGFTTTTSDDRAAVHLAITEVPAPNEPAPFETLTLVESAVIVLPILHITVSDP